MNDSLENRLIEGYPGAFEELFERYADSLMRLSYMLLGQVNDAEDIIQESLISFLEALRSGRYKQEQGTLSAYLRRIVRNRCIDRMKKKGLLTVSLHQIAPTVDDVNQDEKCPLTHLHEKRIRQTIESEIQNMPPLQRTAIIMRLLEEQSHQQIANTLEITIDHVKNLLGRARKRLRESIQPIIEERVS